MNRPTPRSPPQWSLRRWTLVFTFVFVLQLSLLYVLSWRPGGRLPAPPRQIPLQFVTDPDLARRFLDLPWLPDAAQFGQVTPRSFTAAVWEDRLAAELPWRGWREPPVWREPPDTLAAPTLGTFFLRAPLPRVVAAERPTPQAEVQVERLPLAPAQSTLRVEGELRNRRILRQPDLPLVPVEDILPPTVVQVVVGELGEVLSATLQPPGSGHPPADARALELAWQVQFEALGDRPGPFTWGWLVFQWASPPAPSPAQPANPTAP